MTRDLFDLVGKTIASIFRVEAVVAEGGFGVVYRAYHRGFRAPIALKCLKVPPELSERDRAEFLEQFRNEAEIMFRLSASMPNIVRPLHVDAVVAPEGEFVPFMALEWLEGKTLDAIIDRRAMMGRPPLSLETAILLMTPVAQALDQAHHLTGPEGPIAILHRDIKPENIFIADIAGEQVVKVLDFGISKVRRSANEMVSRGTTETSPFSPGYGAPEQWSPKRFGPTGPATDVWGLALTMVEAIKGDVAIIGDGPEMMAMALDPDERPSPRSQGVDVSDDVEAVFQKALAVDPRYRYATVRDFWDSLTHAVGVEQLRRAAEQRSQRLVDLDEPNPGEAWLGFDASRANADRDFSAELSERATNPRMMPDGLPPMVAPTPWRSPVLERLDATKRSREGLPPMLAPAPLTQSTIVPPGVSSLPSELSTLPPELSSLPSELSTLPPPSSSLLRERHEMPSNPASGLGPVPLSIPGLACPDVDAPPPLGDVVRADTSPPAPLSDRGPSTRAVPPTSESRIRLELEPNSVIPEESEGFSPPSIPAAPRPLGSFAAALDWGPEEELESLPLRRVPPRK